MSRPRPSSRPKRPRASSRSPSQLSTLNSQLTPESPSWGGRLNSSPYPASDDTGYRGWRPNLHRDIHRLIRWDRHRSMVSDARYVYGGIGQVSGAVHDKANFAVGTAWIPVYKGADPAFRAAFAEVITDGWIRSCDLRGRPYDWQTDVWLLSKTLDVDGEAFVLLTFSEQGSPRIQIIESHRIGSPWGAEVVPAGQPFAGRRVIEGVVVDDYLRPIAYNLLPEDLYVGYNPDSAPWHLIPAASVIHLYDPRWFTQVRGIPTLCHGILDWYDLGEIRDAEKVGVKSHSKLALLEYNDTGRADPGPKLMANRAAGDPTQVDVGTKLLENGLIRYFKANSGARIEAFSSTRPGATWESFMDHIGRSAHRGMDWPIEMHDMSKIGGAAVRSVTSQVQRSVQQRQGVLWYPCMAMVLYAIARYMQAGRLPLASDWYKIAFTLPPKFSVDVGRDAENRRQDVAMGLRGVDDVLGEEGEGDVEGVFMRRALIWQTRQRVAEATGVPPEAIFNPAAASQPAFMTLSTDPSPAPTDS